MKHLPFALKLRISLRALGQVFRLPHYAALALGAAFMTSELLLWSSSFHLLGYMLFHAPVPLADKLAFPFKAYGSLLVTFSTVQAVSTIILSLVQGMIIAALTYIVRRRRVSSQGVVAGGGAMAVAVFGLGCPTCGTSLLAPIISSVAAGSAATVGAIVGPAINILSILLGLFALYEIGKPLSNEIAKARQNTPEPHENRDNKART